MKRDENDIALEHMMQGMGLSSGNWNFHKDLQKAMINKKDGQLTFIVRVSGGKITDFIELESILYGKSNK
jgi:hypothetical protein